jgi:hypothetical protein
MPQMQTMTLKEKLALGVKADQLYKQGQNDEALKIEMQIPLAPVLAKTYKHYMGLDALLKAGFNLSDAVAEFGSEFLSK